MTVNEIWYQGTENDWNRALEQYWSRVKPENLRLEREMDSLDPQKVKTMTT